MKFGHHQSFYLRINWLAKAFKMHKEEPNFFYSDFGFERIGLGRNMVKALRYWVVATSVMKEAKNKDIGSVHELTPFGQLIMNQDRFIRLPLTSVALHSLLASNREQVTTWYWYFNEYGHRTGSNEDLLRMLDEWVKLHHSRTVSLNTLKRDLDCLKLMYTAQARIEDDPEEVVASPLSALCLLHDSRDQFVKRSPELAELDLDGLYFNLLHYCQCHEVNSVTLEELLVKPGLWGRLFHLSSNQILEALERLQELPYYPVRFVRTNQLYSLSIESEDACSFLRKAYARKAAY
ncbi:DUF4007 family protein [Paenibacillus paeoniae]|uniref:DUF4007 family protein n=1 Tax=Paenibacillus paeoniae TaxID=2292705 RepID=A0A371PE68_9BACL|nr:DUF4007 family protein [Paenibacillus paeoniae]REK74207.1 DUF4007 family protein [Paenibacillus paeoniae]